MRTLENLLLGAILGAIFPILGFLAGWWGIFALLLDRPSFFLLGTSIGLLIGILVDIVWLRKWVSRAYSIDLKIWMAVYLFYSIGMFGFFMGVPVFHVFLAIPAGLFIGSRLAHQNADRAEVKHMSQNTRLFTTGILAVVCISSAVIALVDPYTAGSLQMMLGLPFEVTRGMLVGIIVIGGLFLLLLQWGITAIVIRLAYAWQTNGGNDYQQRDKISCSQ